MTTVHLLNINDERSIHAAIANMVPSVTNINTVHSKTYDTFTLMTAVVPHRKHAVWPPSIQSTNTNTDYQQKKTKLREGTYTL